MADITLMVCCVCFFRGHYGFESMRWIFQRRPIYKPLYVELG
jgi:hypothetical protein